MSKLEEKLQQLHYQAGLRHATDVASGISYGEVEMRELDIASSSTLFDLYIRRLRKESSNSRRFAVDESEGVQSQLNQLARDLDGRRGIWFCLYENQPIAIELAVAPLLTSALALIVTYAGDLMLTSVNAEDGLCVELNHGWDRDEYEIASWGFFGRD